MSSPPNQYNIEALVTQDQIDAEEKLRLEKYLVAGALYSHHTIAENASFDRLPSLLDLHCRICEKEQTFERSTATPTAGDRGFVKIVAYQCRNCKRITQSYMYNWNKQDFVKTGQNPELREHTDAVLRKALGDSLHLYQKATRARNFGFGIGAVAYLRRIIEDRTGQLLDLLKEEKWESWTQAERDEFDNARKTYQYSQKIEYAAEKILPKDVFANGRDSFSALHDVTSSGIHSKSEDECIAIFDRCNLVFTRTFQILHEHKRERDEFAAQLNALKR